MIFFAINKYMYVYKNDQGVRGSHYLYNFFQSWNHTFIIRLPYRFVKTLEILVLQRGFQIKISWLFLYFIPSWGSLRVCWGLLSTRISFVTILSSLNGQFTQKCHHLLTVKSFQPCMIFFLLWNTKEHCM